MLARLATDGAKRAVTRQQPQLIAQPAARPDAPARRRAPRRAPCRAPRRPPRRRCRAPLSRGPVTCAVAIIAAIDPGHAAAAPSEHIRRRQCRGVGGRGGGYAQLADEQRLVIRRPAGVEAVAARRDVDRLAHERAGERRGARGLAMDAHHHSGAPEGAPRAPRSRRRADVQHKLHLLPDLDQRRGALAQVVVRTLLEQIGHLVRSGRVPPSPARRCACCRPAGASWRARTRAPRRAARAGGARGAWFHSSSNVQCRWPTGGSRTTCWLVPGARSMTTHSSHAPRGESSRSGQPTA